jgi:hypothetical protein
MLKLLKKDCFHEIDKAVWDQRPAKVLSYDVDFLGAELRVTVEAKLSVDGAEHTVSLDHNLREEADKVTIDGRAIPGADIDLDFDNHLGWSALEYRAECGPNAQPHEVTLVAVVNWAEVL